MSVVTTQISIDLKKGRIRIHKESLRLIDSPKYIQFLVSVDRSMLAIRGIDTDSSGSAAIRIIPQLQADYEIYSTSLVEKIASAFDVFEETCTYRLTGTVLAEERAVVFPVLTLQKFDPERISV